MCSNEQEFYDGDGADILHSLPASETSSACTLCDLSSALEDEHEQTPSFCEDSSPAEDGRSPSQWTTHLRKLFPDSAKPSAEKPVTMLSICAGTEAPVKAMVDFCDGDHIASVEKDRGAQEFIQQNFNPLHFFRKSSALLQRKPWCERCAAPCGAMHCNIDIAVAGFPCPPSSVLNPGRWQHSHNPMEQKGTEVFFEIVKWLRWYGDLGHTVKLVILENVLGIFMRTRCNGRPPWYYFKKALKTVQTHVLLNVEKLTCHLVGIPMNRGRAIIILVHKEVIGKSISHQALKERVSDSFRLIKCNAMQMQDLASILGCRSIPASPAKRARLDLLPLKLPPKSLQRTKKLRAEKGWPKVGTTVGHPIHSGNL